MNQKLQVEKTENLERIQQLAAGHAHVNQPTSHADRKTFYLAKIDEDVVGCGWIRKLFPGIGAVGGMYVAEQHRGQGFGTELLNNLCNTLSQQGYRIIMLGVHRSNTGAINLYRRNGFRRIFIVPPFPGSARIARGLEHVFRSPLPPEMTYIMARWR